MNVGVRKAIRKIKKSLILMRRPGSRAALLRFGVAGAIEHDAVLRAAPFDLIVDVGANRGQFSLAARNFHPNAKIVAFEPLASAASVYRRVFRDDTLVSLHETAIGPKQCTVVMQRSGSEDSSSLLTISDLMPELYPGTQAVGTEIVAVAPLTNFLARTDFAGGSLLKIDVQGYEVEVLKSAELLLPLFDRIYVEASFLPLYEGQVMADELISFLQEHHFKIVGILNPSFHPVTGLTVQADMLFINADRT
jgi:FkbM family methyltransferase